MKIRPLHLLLIYRYPTHFPTYRKTGDFGPFCITLSPLHSRSYTTATTLSVIHIRYYTFGYYTLGHTLLHLHIGTYIYTTTLSVIHYRHYTLGHTLPPLHSRVLHYSTYIIAEVWGFICHSFIDILLISPHIGKPGIFDHFVLQSPHYTLGHTLLYLHTGTYIYGTTYRHIHYCTYTPVHTYTVQHTGTYIYGTTYRYIHIRYYIPVHTLLHIHTGYTLQYLHIGTYIYGTTHRVYTVSTLHSRSYTTVHTLLRNFGDSFVTHL